MAELREELDRALSRPASFSDGTWEVLCYLSERIMDARIGAVHCPGDHGAALPCELCGAAL